MSEWKQKAIEAYEADMAERARRDEERGIEQDAHDAMQLKKHLARVGIDVTPVCGIVELNGVTFKWDRAWEHMTASVTCNRCYAPVCRGIVTPGDLGGLFAAAEDHVCEAAQSDETHAPSLEERLLNVLREFVYLNAPVQS